MEDWEANSLQRQARQEGGNNNGTNGNNQEPYPAGTFSNVANILTGLFQEDVRPIVSGSTAFIPPGNLRQVATGLLQNLSPALQVILFGEGSRIPATDFTIPTLAPVPITEPPPTSPRPRIRTMEEEATTEAGTTPEDLSEEETDSPSTPESSVSSSVQPAAFTPVSSEYEEETEPAASPTETASTDDPSLSSISASPPTNQVFNPLETEIVNKAVTPESARAPGAQAELQPVPIVSSLPTSPLVASQMKVMLEDTNSNSIVTANVMSNPLENEKKYFYLVLLPDQYEEFTKLTDMKRKPMSQFQREAPFMATEKEKIPQSTTSTNSNTNNPISKLEFPIAPTTITQSGQSATNKPISKLEFPFAPTTNTQSTTKQSIYKLEIPIAPTTVGYRRRNRNRNQTTTTSPPHLQLQYYYQLTTSTTTSTTTTTEKTTSTDLPGVKGFEEDDDEHELENYTKMTKN